ISTSSLNTGGAKPWPHTASCGVSTRSGRRNSGASGPSVERLRSSVAASSRHRMAAEAQQHARVALVDEVERIAQVEAGDRAARSLQLVFLAGRLAGREHERRAIELFLDARSDDA